MFSTEVNSDTMTTAAVMGAYLAWLAVALLVIWWRYRRAEATR